MMSEEELGFVKKIDGIYGDIRIELHIGEPYLNEAQDICIPLLRRLYVMKKNSSKVSKKEHLQ